LNENGILSAEVKTEFGNDDEEPVNAAGIVEDINTDQQQNQ